MRIRKRQVPLPLSSLLPVPLSDLYSSQSPANTSGGVGGGVGGDDGCRGGAPPHHPRPSDLSDGLIQRWGIDGCGLSDHGAHDDDDEKKKNLKEEDETLGDKKCEEGEEEESNEVDSKNVDLGPGIAVGNPSRESIFPSQEGKKFGPLKKRRGNNYEEDNNKAKASVDVEEKTKKCVGETKKSEGNLGSMASKGRKKVRGGALAEGSRCSRVNGRGWRCCQQTLVGYSLCEHHLGKGRLRSMSASAKNKNGNNKETTRQRQSTSTRMMMTTMTNSEEDEEEESGKDEKASKKKKKKKVKLGMVKARSISSLLGQTSGTEIVAPTDHYGDGDK